MSCIASPALGTQEFFQTYVGTAGQSIDGSPNALNARMTLLSNPLTPEEEFTELFLGRRKMQVGLKLIF